ncbi:hypothetical protein ACFZB6_17800 [Streptomyces syringium]|uniref:hypothetical protein n=1 Tax=Streptomyces syringium TaxID=76729 RepID=UPI0036E654C2
MFLAVLATIVVLASVAILIYKAPPAETFVTVAVLGLALIRGWVKLRRPSNADRRPGIFGADFDYSNKVEGKGTTLKFRVGGGAPGPGADRQQEVDADEQ